MVKLVDAMSSTGSPGTKPLKNSQFKSVLTISVSLAPKTGEKPISSFIFPNPPSLLTIDTTSSVLRAQTMELNQRLQSLNEIINYINSSTAVVVATAAAMPPATNCVFQAEEFQGFSDGFLNNPWNLMYINQQPIMVSADMFDY
ncbi:bZIP transcription factor 11-like [Olea europaea var. sylvestris]|uniref:bZIP transcription factor 11-like n=1 Tax=Olea europaea var. sylvestris TaxID=158386 RepID=UPI000C1D8343|nr:bZIP transcription factor 11-like [Olea europaea var. sylvestris]